MSVGTWHPSMAWFVRTMIASQSCTFTVDHTHIDVSSGGRQGDQITYGPYRGGLYAPGTRQRFLQPILSADTAGEVVDEPRWTLVAPADTQIVHDAANLDFVQVVDIGRFRVAAVRPIGQGTTPDGWLVGLELMG